MMVLIAIALQISKKKGERLFASTQYPVYGEQICPERLVYVNLIIPYHFSIPSAHFPIATPNPFSTHSLLENFRYYKCRKHWFYHEYLWFLSYLYRNVLAFLEISFSFLADTSISQSDSSSLFF